MIWFGVVEIDRSISRYDCVCVSMSIKFVYVLAWQKYEPFKIKSLFSMLLSDVCRTQVCQAWTPYRLDRNIFFSVCLQWMKREKKWQSIILRELKRKKKCNFVGTSINMYSRMWHKHWNIDGKITLVQWNLLGFYSVYSFEV